MKRLFWVYGVMASIILLMGSRCMVHKSPGLMERWSSYVIYPVIRAQQTVITPLKNFFVARATRHELEHTIQQLQQERDTLMQEVIQLRATVMYDQETKELVEYNRMQQIPVKCTAQIMARHLTGSCHYFLIDVGSTHGIEKDMVVVYKQALIGKVSDVYPWYSKVMAITDSSCKISASCTQTLSTGIHEGANSTSSTRLSFVSHLQPVIEGDLVVSSGQGTIFPRGLGLGHIVGIRKQELFYHIEVRPLVDLQKIAYCSIVQKGVTNIPSTAETQSSEQAPAEAICQDCGPIQK